MSAAETSRDVAFCAHAILDLGEILEVRDAQLDPRFADNPLVTSDPHIRFYAGAPLVTPDGLALGTLCVIDSVPRVLGAEQKTALRALSRIVIAQLGLHRTLAAHRRTQEQLQSLNASIEQKVEARTAELAQFKSALDHALDSVYIFHPDTLRFVYANHGSLQQVGYSEDELMRMTPLDIKPEFTEPSFRALLKPLLDGSKATISCETVHRHKDGHETPVEIGLQLVRQGEQVSHFIFFSRDITARRAAEAKIKRLTGLYAALNQCSQAIVRCTSEGELFLQICRAAVQFGGMKMAWVGMLDDASQLVKPVAWYGTDTDYLEGIQISVNADEPAGRGGTGTAIRENRPVWIQDFLNDPRLAPWRERGTRAGWRAAAALPLLRQGKVIGAFSLNSGELNAFDEVAHNLLEEMARDIGQALDHLSLQAERKQTEEQLRIAATAFESQQGMMITDANSVILRVNRAFTKTTGYTAEEAVGQTPSLLQSGRHDKAFYAGMWESIKDTGGWQGEIWDRRKNGEIYPKWLTITAVKADDGTVTHYVGTHADISERKAADEQIAFLAYHDALTGLPNRRLLQDRLQQALASGARSGRNGALFLLDLDNFKTLNDTLGHDTGDLLLQQVGHRLATCVREGDTVARLGGDEFVVLLEGLSDLPEEAAKQAEALGEKILATLNQPYLLAGHETRSTPSIGVTLFSGQQTSMEELMKQTDLAMYQSKTAGRNTLRFFDARMQAIVTERAALEVDLREAVRQQQFILHYQPQGDFDGHLTGAEALVRWQHPQRGMVSPAEFIPLAEETNLILPLGLWVLETACAQLATWANQPNTVHLTMAVNVSANQLQQADFVDQVLAVLKTTGANPHRLKLELTESLLVSNVETTIAKMTALKAHGVGFALDDFGTGYSSLSYLKRLPLDQLKIDQGFVRDILIDTNDAAIARMVIVLAGSLGLTVMAEGVETEAQRTFLASQGCHAYQGYLFSRPLPLDAFEAFVEQIWLLGQKAAVR